MRAVLNTDPAIDKPKTTKGGQWHTMLHKINLEKVSFEVLMPQSDQMIEVDLPLAAIDLGHLVLGDSSLQLLIDLRAPLITHYLPAKPSAQTFQGFYNRFHHVDCNGCLDRKPIHGPDEVCDDKRSRFNPVIQELSGQFSDLRRKLYPSKSKTLLQQLTNIHLFKPMPFR